MVSEKQMFTTKGWFGGPPILHRPVYVRTNVKRVAFYLYIVIKQRLSKTACEKTFKINFLHHVLTTKRKLTHTIFERLFE